MPTSVIDTLMRKLWVGSLSVSIGRGCGSWGHQLSICSKETTYNETVLSAINPVNARETRSHWWSWVRRWLSLMLMSWNRYGRISLLSRRSHVDGIRRWESRAAGHFLTFVSLRMKSFRVCCVASLCVWRHLSNDLLVYCDCEIGRRRMKRKAKKNTFMHMVASRTAASPDNIRALSVKRWAKSSSNSFDDLLNKIQDQRRRRRRSHVAVDQRRKIIWPMIRCDVQDINEWSYRRPKPERIR